MKEKHVGKAPVASKSTNWERLRGLSDREIRTGLEADPEVRPTDVEFWKMAKVARPESKQR